MAQDALQLADEASDVADAFVTLAVHAGIAAADVICAVRLGQYSKSENHNDAAALLGKVATDVQPVQHLHQGNIGRSRCWGRCGYDRSGRFFTTHRG